MNLLLPRRGGVTIPNGQASATVTVTPPSDSEYEPNEVVLLTLVTGEYAVSATALTAGVRICDEEPLDPPGNVAPVAGDDTVLTSEGTPKLVKVIANDGDYDGDPVSVVSAGSAAHGTV